MGESEKSDAGLLSVTGIETRAVVALRSVIMPDRGWHARRREFLNGLMTREPYWHLDSLQAADLWFLVWRYRRQITDAEVVAKANEIVNGALNLAF